MADKPRVYHHRDRTAELQEVAERLIVERDELRAQADGFYDEVMRLRAQIDADTERFAQVGLRLGQADAEIARLRAALSQILKDPDAKILDSHRDDGWAALA